MYADIACLAANWRNALKERSDARWKIWRILFKSPRTRFYYYLLQVFRQPLYKHEKHEKLTDIRNSKRCADIHYKAIEYACICVRRVISSLFDFSSNLYFFFFYNFAIIDGFLMRLVVACLHTSKQWFLCAALCNIARANDDHFISQFFARIWGLWCVYTCFFVYFFLLIWVKKTWVKMDDSILKLFNVLKRW